MEVRPMVIEDYDQVVAVWKAAGLEVDEYDDSKEKIREIIRMNAGGCLVGEVDGEVAAAVLGTFNGKRAWVYHLAVHPDFQGEGWGSLLMGVLEDWFTSVGAKKVKLAVLKSNKKAIPFYKNCGYLVEDNVVILEKELRCYTELK